jgi:hypothetical protein
MRVITFSTHRAIISKILDHIEVDSERRHITPARGPLLWDARDAQTCADVEAAPYWGETSKPEREFEVDLRINRQAATVVWPRCWTGCACHRPKCVIAKSQSTRTVKSTMQIQRGSLLLIQKGTMVNVILGFLSVTRL